MPDATNPVTATNPFILNPTSLQNYMTQYGNAMTPGGGALGTSEFQQSPAYGLLFGPQAGATFANNPVTSLLQQPQLSAQDFMNSGAYKLQYGNNNATDPGTRFQNDPGVQQAIQAAMPAIANNYSAQGLGASGTAADAVAQYMYNNYNNYTSGQQNLYQSQYNNALTQQQQNVATYVNQQGVMNNSLNQYNGQLAALAGAGSSASNNVSNSLSSTLNSLGQLLSSNNMNTGNSLASLGANAADIISQLQANLGTLQANAYLGTGAGMSNNILQGSILGAQLANAQNGSNAHTANSALQGQGASNGVSALGQQGF